MLPTLYLGLYPLSMYYLCMFVACLSVFFLGIWWNYTSGRRYPISVWITLWAAVPAFWVGRSVYFLTHTCPNNLDRFWDLSAGGNMFIGVFLGGIIGTLAYLACRRIPLLDGLDIFTPYVPIGGIIGRMGCLFHGCCFGCPSDLPWAITFDGSSPAFISQVKSISVSPMASLPLPVHPTEIYAILAWIIIGGILIRLRRWGLPTGGVTLVLIWLYSLKRILLDFFRGDHPRILWEMNGTQLVAIPVLLICSGLLVFVIAKTRAEQHARN